MLEEMCLIVPGSLDSCCVIRDRVMQAALQLPFSSGEIDDIHLAVGEAASNAVRHGCKCNADAKVSVRCWTQENELCIQVRDHGCGFDPSAVHDPDFMLLPEGGM